MTLVAGVIAFVAVIIQIRSSSKQLHDQMKAHRDSEREELERQKKAVATAILFEIDDFYHYHVRGVYGYLEERTRTRTGALTEVIRIPPSLFAVYSGNTPRLGELPDEVVEVIIHFYSKAEQFLALREDYKAAAERLTGSIVERDYLKTMTLFGHLRDSLPGLTRAAYIACDRLASFTGVSFQSPRIAVAAEDLAALNRDTERIEHEKMHRI